MIVIGGTQTHGQGIAVPFGTGEWVSATLELKVDELAAGLSSDSPPFGALQRLKLSSFDRLLEAQPSPFDYGVS